MRDIVADAPAPWEPFDVESLGMRRDFGTAEWVGISFWEPRAVAMESCRWKDSWQDAGESVAELADALVAIPGRAATEEGVGRRAQLGDRRTVEAHLLHKQMPRKRHHHLHKGPSCFPAY